MCGFNNWLLSKGAGSCLAAHSLSSPLGECQEQLSAAALSHPRGKGVQTGHETSIGQGGNVLGEFRAAEETSRGES